MGPSSSSSSSSSSCFPHHSHTVSFPGVHGKEGPLDHLGCRIRLEIVGTPHTAELLWPPWLLLLLLLLFLLLVSAPFPHSKLPRGAGRQGGSPRSSWVQDSTRNCGYSSHRRAVLPP